MIIENIIVEFKLWLKSLTDGEATLYGILLTGFVAFLGWIIKKYRQQKPVQPPSTHNHASKGSLTAGTINGSDIKIININKVKASHGGTATGVIIEKNSEQKNKQDEQNGN